VNIAATRKEGIIMVAGRLQEKKGHYYIVLSYKDESGKHKTKWISTGLIIKGNKKKAESMLLEERKNFEIPVEVPDEVEEEKITFAQYMKNWLAMIKPNVELTTYGGYSLIINNVIYPYFEDKGILLTNLQPKQIQEFYTYCMTEKGVSANTVIHYHANIRKALKYAVDTDLIPTNPADKVQRPRVHKYIGKFYDIAEVNELFEVVKGSKIELAVKLAAFYGLRRGEIAGLKWDAIDFVNRTITIRHTVTMASVGGKYITVVKDRTKNKSSNRSLPLVQEFYDILMNLKEEQKENRKLCKKSYNTEFLEYVFVDAMGNRVNPNLFTDHLRIIIKKNNLRKIRFHDLRHTCASLLLANGVSMKEIQDWLGHSDFSTTANIYGHLDVDAKRRSTEAMLATGINLVASA